MALQCITLQWKITSLLIYLIIYGFFHLSSLINQDNLYKFQKHVINSIKQYHRYSVDHSDDDNHTFDDDVGVLSVKSV